MVEVDYVVVGLGALGSGAAWQLATRGHSVVGLEQFELGHSRGASHDTSRILRHSYHTPAYVRLTCEAYDDWARLEAESGESLVTVVGGLDLFPPDCAIRPDDYLGVVARGSGSGSRSSTWTRSVGRWPQFHPPDGTLGLFQERGAIVPAARGTAAMQRLAVEAGATLLGSTPVSRVTDHGTHVEVEAGDTTYTCRGVVVGDGRLDQPGAGGARGGDPVDGDPRAADVLRAAGPRGVPGHPAVDLDGRAVVLRLPCYGEDTVKAAQDCGGPVVDPDRSDVGAGSRDARPAGVVHGLAAARERAGGAVAPLSVHAHARTGTSCSRRCRATRASWSGLGSAHGFKFAPTFGRILADLVATGETTVRRLGVRVRPARVSRIRRTPRTGWCDVSDWRRLARACPHRRGRRPPDTRWD